MDKKSKLKQANRFAITSFLFCFICGGFLIFRSEIKDDQLITYQGTLERAEILRGFGNYSKSYAIILNLEESEKKLGMYAGTREQASEKLKNLKLVNGKKYKLFVDPTVLQDFNDFKLGVRKITMGNQVIFKENMKANRFFGSFLILSGLLSSTIIYMIAKRKFKE